jgi:SsrA-binding protein
MGKKKKTGGNTIALNKKANHDYFIDERFEAGLSLEGWEVKSLRAGKVQIIESYILLKNNEAYLFGALITPLITTSTHVKTDPRRSRKLLLHRSELNRLVGAVERKGFTLVPTALYWKHGKVKLELGIGRGKKAHDKRATEKNRDWDRQKAQLLRHK